MQLHYRPVQEENIAIQRPKIPLVINKHIVNIEQVLLSHLQRYTQNVNLNKWAIKYFWKNVYIGYMYCIWWRGESILVDENPQVFPNFPSGHFRSLRISHLIDATSWTFWQHGRYITEPQETTLAFVFLLCTSCRVFQVSCLLSASSREPSSSNTVYIQGAKTKKHVKNIVKLQRTVIVSETPTLSSRFLVGNID